MQVILHTILRFMLALLMGLGLAIMGFQSNGQAASWRIFVLHSFGKDNICGRPQHRGLIRALNNKGLVEGEKVTFSIHFMDVLGESDRPAPLNQLAQEALAAIEAFKPHVLVTLDDDAFHWVALKLVDTPIKIVFSGLNGLPEDYNQMRFFMRSRQAPQHNVTGVWEKLHFSDALRIQQRIMPMLQKVRVLTDQSLTGCQIMRQIEAAMVVDAPPVAVDLVSVASWEAYQREVAFINQSETINAVYPVIMSLTDDTGKTHAAQQVVNWTVQHCKKPAIALNYEFVRLGLFGGAVVDFERMGYQAGLMVSELLNGKQPGEIPIAETRRFALVFNLARALDLGVEIPFEILLAADDIITEVPR